MTTNEILLLAGGLAPIVIGVVTALVGQYLRILQYKAALKNANALTDVDDIKPEPISNLLRIAGRKGKGE